MDYKVLVYQWINNAMATYAFLVIKLTPEVQRTSKLLYSDCQLKWLPHKWTLKGKHLYIMKNLSTYICNCSVVLIPEVITLKLFPWLSEPTVVFSSSRLNYKTVYTYVNNSPYTEHFHFSHHQWNASFPVNSIHCDEYLRKRKWFTPLVCQLFIYSMSVS